MQHFWPLIALLLTLQAALGLDAARRLTVTHDEYWHLPIGLRIWQAGRFDEDVINPPLVRLWTALPLAMAGIPAGDAGERPTPLEIGDAFLHANRERYVQCVWAGRAMIVLLTALTGALLAARLRLLPDTLDSDEAVALWGLLGVADAARVPDLDVDALRSLRTV